MTSAGQKDGPVTREEKKEKRARRQNVFTRYRDTCIFTGKPRISKKDRNNSLLCNVVKTVRYDTCGVVSVLWKSVVK